MQFSELSRDDVLRALGLRTRRSTGEVFLPFLTLAGGVALGLGLARLLARRLGPAGAVTDTQPPRAPASDE